MREADVAIRMKEPSQADLVRKRLMDIRMQLFATPDYLAQAGTPGHCEDLGSHRLICQNVHATQVSAGAQLVRELMAYGANRLLTVNNYFGVLQSTLAGVGIGILPDYLQQDFPTLVPVLPDVGSNDVPVFLAYPEELRGSRRIEAFRDFVVEEVVAYRRRREAA